MTIITITSTSTIITITITTTITITIGRLAVVYDKNDMEASGYAAALADVTQETVH
jgi:hypothetical protein